jgi:hypothetical protein
MCPGTVAFLTSEPKKWIDAVFGEQQSRPHLRKERAPS